MNIGLDFDGTVTTNSKMWSEIVKIFNKNNINVYIVTYRNLIDYDNSDIDEFVNDTKIEVIYTNCKAKDRFCKELGINIDIWIDDNPVGVLTSLTRGGYKID